MCNLLCAQVQKVIREILDSMAKVVHLARLVEMDRLVHRALAVHQEQRAVRVTQERKDPLGQQAFQDPQAPTVHRGSLGHPDLQVRKGLLVNQDTMVLPESQECARPVILMAYMHLEADVNLASSKPAPHDAVFPTVLNCWFHASPLFLLAQNNQKFHGYLRKYGLFLLQ